MSRQVEPVAQWARVRSVLLCLVGLGLSIYLTIEHFGNPGLLICSSNSVINCAIVTTSKWSYFLGIPVAVLGLANYVAMTALCSPWAWRSSWYWLHATRLAMGVISMVFVLWLITAEIVLIGKICLFCTAVHLVTFALLIVLSRVSPNQLGWAASPAE